MTEPTRTTDSVEVGVRLPREVKVDHYIDGNDVDASCEDVGTDQAAGLTSLEVMENTTKRHWS